jgi:hypothetical protein
MLSARPAVSAICVLLLVTTPLWAGPGKPTAPRTPHAAAVHGPSAKSVGHGATVKTKPVSGSHAAHGPKAKSSPSTHGPKAGSKSAGSGHAKTTHGKSSHAKTTGKAAHTSTTAGATTTDATPLGPNVPKNPKLQARLQAMLPPGMTLDVAALGFKNQGQFIAALHVSQNLGIPFTDLKTRMVDQHLSLGQAIQSVKGDVDGTAAARVAEQQAAADLTDGQ